MMMGDGIKESEAVSWEGGLGGAEITSYDYESEISNVLATFASCAQSLQLEARVSSAILSSLRESSLRSVILNGSKCGFRLDDQQVAAITQCLVQSQLLLETLCLTYHAITDAGLEHICSSLLAPQEVDSQSMHLEILDLEGNDITEAGLEHLRLGSSKACPLLSLNLSCNPLGESGGIALAAALQSNRSLRQLLVNNCGFTLNALLAISTSMGIEGQGKKSVLEEIQIDRPILDKSIKEDGADHFSRVLLQSTALSDLSLRFHSIGDLGARLLASSLGRCPSIVSLNLDCNKIGVAGAEGLASYLISQATSKGQGGGLRSLRLSYNVVGNQGAIALAEALVVNKQLLELTLKNNSIGEAGLIALGNALCKNNTLKRLAVFGNEFDSDSCKLYDDIITTRLPYLDLTLDVVTYVVDGRVQIAENV